jgi:diaminopimelate epimerase
MNWVYSGAGNTFLLIDNRSGEAQLSFVDDLDGTILLEASQDADYRMRIFNRDGSEAEMCGNGLRCLGALLLDLGLPRRSYTIETLAGVHEISYSDAGITTTLPSPTILNPHLELLGIKVFLVDTGVPHAVIEGHHHFDLAPQIRSHSAVGPRGTNVTTVERHSDHLTIRTYERGVEGETLACGTGAAAAGVAMGLSAANIVVQSGASLRFELTPSGIRLTGIAGKCSGIGPASCLRGPAIDGVFLLAQDAEALGSSDSALADGAAKRRRARSTT